MPLTATAKAIALDAAIKGVTPPLSVTHAGLYKWSEAGKNLTTPFGTASTDIFTSTAHGYANGDLVLMTALTGAAGVVVLDPYFIISTLTNTFQLSKTVGGTAVDFTTDATAGTVRRLVELTGGSPAYARKAIAWASASAALEQIDDSTNGIAFDVPLGGAVDYVSGHSASTAGTLMVIDDAQTPETFAAQGIYTLTDFKINGTT
jgi:hypothetical protein